MTLISLRDVSIYPCSCFGDTLFKSLIMVLGMMVELEHRVVSDKVWVKRLKMHHISRSPHKYRGAHVRKKQSKADFEISHVR